MAKAGKRTTVRFLDSLRGREKEYTITMIDGITVRVFTSGRKVLLYLYTSPTTSQRRKYRLGEWGKISLADAFKRLKAAERMVEKKEDPQEEEKLEREVIKVKDLVELYLELWARPRKRTWREDERNLRKDILPRWKNKRAKDIKLSNVVALLDDVAYRGRGEKKDYNSAQPRQVLAVTRKMFNFALSRSLVDFNPCHGVVLPVEPPQPRKRPLSEEEVRQFWHKLHGSGMREDFQRILRLVLVTGQRPGECAGVSWEEIEGSWWTLPGERSKNRRESRVYLSDLAKEIMGDPGEGFLFPMPKDPGRPVVNNDVSKAMRKALPALELKNVKPHDLRATFTTLASKAQISPEVQDRILNHVQESTREKHYDGYDFALEKRQALEKWTRQFKMILEGKAAEKVTHFPSGVGL